MDVKDVKPANPVKPVRRRWYAPDDKSGQQQNQSPESDSAAKRPRRDDGHVDEYV